eukprot:CAMPEP_0197421168 /NCGR_PEP_ID=MMETSP1170-20131217/6508_1 /TAXON_ID=54406 /ORGANISM="Sarcinochrysis sp, Strain CCMP770" /LENGTH=49 /DNA_ID=CAMNT_0042948379 /DNA_START=88 /DNA_END=237 /DNA_ORIENTATION=-
MNVRLLEDVLDVDEATGHVEHEPSNLLQIKLSTQVHHCRTAFDVVHEDV